VEPRGFEPLTSAVQSQGTTVTGVRGCSGMPPKWWILLYDASLLFAIVRVGWCTNGVPAKRQDASALFSEDYIRETFLVERIVVPGSTRHLC
jgi:hypothetical protein